MATSAARYAVGQGTTRRFLLLVCVLVLAGVFLLNTIALAARPGSFLECASAAGVDLGGLMPDLALQRNAAFTECRDGVAAAANRLALLATGGVLLAAVAVYWSLPSWRLRGRRLLPISAFPALREALLEHLAGLAKRVGVTRMPSFVVDPRAMTAGAVVFGRLGRYTVCLHAGLIPRYASDRRRFDAVLLHELAHLRNRDVDIAYFTEALWRVLLAAVVLPYVALETWLLVRIRLLGAADTLWAQAAPSTGSLAYAAVLVALVYLTRAEALRSREVCADLDAIAAGADPSVWGDLYRAETGRRDLARRLLGLWRTHPTWTRRHQSLIRVYDSSTFLQTVLFAATLIVAFTTAMSVPLPVWFLTSALYLVGPLLVIGLMAEASGKHGGHYINVDLAPRDLPPPPRVRRRLTLIAAGLAALFVWDPLGGLKADGTIGFLGLPSAYRQPSNPGPPPPLTEVSAAEVSAWLDNGGRAAAIRLSQALAVEPARFAGAAPGTPEWDAYTAHCTDIERAVAGADALPELPAPLARVFWEGTVSLARQGSQLLCAARPDGDRARLAARFYVSARRAYDQCGSSVNSYVDGGLPRPSLAPALVRRPRTADVAVVRGRVHTPQRWE